MRQKLGCAATIIYDMSLGEDGYLLSSLMSRNLPVNVAQQTTTGLAFDGAMAILRVIAILLATHRTPNMQQIHEAGGDLESVCDFMERQRGKIENILDCILAWVKREDEEDEVDHGFEDDEEKYPKVYVLDGDYDIVKLTCLY